MSTRVKTALVTGSLFMLLLGFGGELGFGAIVAAFAVLGAAEYQRLGQPQTQPKEVWFVAGWAGAIVLGFLADSPMMPGALLALGVAFYFAAWVFGAGPTARTLGAWGTALGSWIFVAYFLGHALWIRRFGVSPILFILAVVWLGDTAAYYVGTAFGTHRLAPLVSPKKSVEGAAASLVAGTCGAALTGLILPLPHGIFASVALGIALNAAAQFGDLAESLLKRCAGVKDSGTLFPGHGGVLDRVDGFLLSLPLYAGFLTARGV